jgi:hypothetical protein
MVRWRGKLNGDVATVRVGRPLVRTDDLVVEQLGDELLVYDRRNNRAHCLSADAARVWRACDGNTDIETLCEALDSDRDTVVRALEELERAELLESHELEIVSVNGNGKGKGNGHRKSGGITRRELGSRGAKVGTAVVAAPLILSISAPTPAAAATPPAFFCEIFTTQSCGASAGCGSIAGCCCCNKSCPGAGSCKGCTSIAACTSGNQPCAGSPDPAGTDCSDAKGTNPFTVCGCCGPPFFPNIGGSSSGCGCGWGNPTPVNSTGISTSGQSASNPANPGSGCCDMTSMGPTVATGFVMCTSAATCVPCCNGQPIYPGSHFGCCGGYFAPNAATDVCVHTKPVGYPTTCS